MCLLSNYESHEYMYTVTMYIYIHYTVYYIFWIPEFPLYLSIIGSIDFVLEPTRKLCKNSCLVAVMLLMYLLQQQHGKGSFNSTAALLSAFVARIYKHKLLGCFHPFTLCSNIIYLNVIDRSVFGLPTPTEMYDQTYLEHVLKCHWNINLHCEATGLRGGIPWW